LACIPAGKVKLSPESQLETAAANSSTGIGAPMTWEPSTQNDQRQIVLPLHEEKVQVGKQRVVTGSVRISTVTREREQLVDELLGREDVEIERRPVGKEITRAPAVRRAGNTIIIPMIEEVLVVSRRLVLKEEIRIRLVQKKERSRQRVTLRKQELIVSRHPASLRDPAGTGR
jgi:uncharacterized protein (TIGR02271 family)